VIRFKNEEILIQLSNVLGRLENMLKGELTP
jgi:very-short-patch-repair endonuclease